VSLPEPALPEIPITIGFPFEFAKPKMGNII
jgi:hypothetical protein